MCDFKAGADQQVLGLEAKQISHRKLVDKTFRSTVWVSDVVDQFNSIDLSMTIESHHPIAARNPSTVCRGEVRLVFRLLARWTSEKLQRGVEEVQDEDTVIDQVPANLLEACELVFDGQQVPERIETES